MKDEYWYHQANHALSEWKHKLESSDIVANCEQTICDAFEYADFIDDDFRQTETTRINLIKSARKQNHYLLTIYPHKRSVSDGFQCSYPSVIIGDSLSDWLYEIYEEQESMCPPQYFISACKKSLAMDNLGMEQILVQDGFVYEIVAHQILDTLQS